MKKLIILALLGLSLIGCKELDDARNGNEIDPNDPSTSIEVLRVFADFELDFAAARVSQIKGLMTLPDFISVRNLRDDTKRFLQVEVIDYSRNLQVVSVCYESNRDGDFEYDRTLFEYGDCTDDVAWTRDLATLNFYIEKSDTVIITGFGDFENVQNEFRFNVVTK